MTEIKKLISIVVPAFNEEDCIDELARRLTSVMDGLTNYQFEALIVENGSTDKTWSLLQKIASSDKRFKPIRLSRNFGMDGGVTAGLELATGDACVIMTADLQDPPELIVEFIAKWESGYENIFMIVEKRSTSNVLRRVNSKLFYFMADRLTGGIKHPRPARFGGESKARLSTVLRLAKHGILSFSDIPLRFITWFGLVCSGLALGTMVVFAILKFVIGTPFAGFATIVTIVLFFFGLLSFMIGILAEYVAMIHSEVKNRPNFIIAEKLNQ